MPDGDSRKERVVSSIKLPRQRHKEAAEWLLKCHPVHRSTSLLRRTRIADTIRVVCISDTHNKHPELPPGDILIHAGDLTENGSFDEFQEGLSWLSRQPHAHKILIAGNHDVILDEGFLARYPERRYRDVRTKEDLEWGSVVYLENAATTLSVGSRNVSIFGSPWTPRYGASAFQHNRDEDIWANRIPAGVDIVVVHGPPHLHVDKRDFHRAGCQFLAAEVTRVRPRLVVFGHIHAAYGREDVVLDRARRTYEEVIGGWAGWASVLLLALDVLLAKVMRGVWGETRYRRRQTATTFVNAAVVGGPHNELQNEAMFVRI